MQAVLKDSPRPGARLVDVPTPEPGLGEVLLKVEATSICGTDLHIWLWDEWAAARVHPPRIMGHECAGRVVALGPGAKGVREGELVAVETHVTCGVCRACRVGEGHICESVAILGVDRDGTFAEYVVVPAENCVRVEPPDLDPALAAIQEPFGNAVHTAFAGELTLQRVAVIGCGPIGLMAVAIAKDAGARRVLAADIHPERLRLAGEMGADAVVDTREEDLTARMLAESDGHGFDVVLEMSGAPSALTAALKGARMGARVSLLGLPSNPVTLDLAEDVIMRGLTLQGITGRRLFDTWERTRALFASGRLPLQKIITHRLPLSEVGRAMELLKEGAAAKVVLFPGH
jgi:threonine 3-dehydrogenase